MGTKAPMPLLFDDEGGYCNDAHDPGGATKWGITWRDLQAWLGRKVTTQDVRNITQDLAAQIYKAKYWTVVHGDELPSGVDYMVFDYGVNSGTSRAIKYLQSIVGAEQDGIMGGMTLAAVKRMDPVDIIEKLYKKRMGFLQSLRTWIYFGKGWKRRVDGVYKNSLSWAKDGGRTVIPLVINPPAPDANVAVTPIVSPVVTPVEKKPSWWENFTNWWVAKPAVETYKVGNEDNDWTGYYSFEYQVPVVSVAPAANTTSVTFKSLTKKVTKKVEKKVKPVKKASAKVRK